MINQKPVDIEIKGKPVMIVTAATVSPSKETLRRFTILNLDESINQTKEIMKRQAKLAAKGESLEYNEQARAALAKLKRVKVKVPFAETLVELFPTSHVIMRTHFNRFLDYIKASTALHQFQREVDDDSFYLSRGQDYDIGRIALLKTTSNAEMLPLTKDEQRLLGIFREKDKQVGEKLFYSVSELGRHATFFNESKLRRELDKLTELGFLKKDTEQREESRKAVYVYQIQEIGDIEIPTWEELQRMQKNEVSEIGETAEISGGCEDA